MVRSGERPDSANTDWLASQNDSFYTVALFTEERSKYCTHTSQYRNMTTNLSPRVIAPPLRAPPQTQPVVVRPATGLHARARFVDFLDGSRNGFACTTAQWFRDAGFEVVFEPDGNRPWQAYGTSPGPAAPPRLPPRPALRARPCTAWPAP